MGISNSSREGNWRQSSSNHSDSSSWDSYLWYPQYLFDQETPSFTPQSPPYYPPSRDHDNATRMLQRKFSRIADNYDSLDQVKEALVNAGLESLNLIVGIDFTKSNEWTGKRSFNGKSLHHIGDGLNPYEEALSIIGEPLAVFDEDNSIPCFGFGDASTHDQDVFSFYPDKRDCKGFEEVLTRYREILPHLRLAGPTSFAPIIEMAMTLVEKSCGQYHVLVIIADGQVTRSVDTGQGRLSPQEQKTVDAIVQASKLPLSIIMVGVGDGPWDTMKEFDDNIPARAFDNFQFVNFTDIMSTNVCSSCKETEFALAALLEIPSQYKAAIELNILGDRKGNVPERVPLPPRFNSSKPSQSTKDRNPVSSTPQAPASTYDSRANPFTVVSEQLCSICLNNPKDMAFGCGHQTCEECSRDLQTCPICWSPIRMKLKLYL